MSTKKDKANLYWLPVRLEHPKAFNEESSEVRLPVAAIDLVRLSTKVGQSRRAMEPLLRTSPGLLLFGLAGFRERFGRSPDSTKEFACWCQPNLIGSLADVDFGAASPSEHRLTKKLKKRIKKQLSYAKLGIFFENHLSGQSNQELKKSLRKFTCLFTNLSKRESREWVELLVGKKILGRKLKCKRRRSAETRWAIIDDWIKPMPHIEVGKLIQNSSAGIESSLKFQDRLHEEKMASMKQLAYGASHEINNPLANISTRAQTLLASEQDHEKRQKLAVIYEQAIRAHEMISDMMLFANPPAVKVEDMSVRLLIKKILAELEPQLDANPGVDLRVTVGVGVEQVKVDVNQFCVAVKNLIRNSFEAIASSGKPVVQFEGKIEVRFERKQSGLEVSVWDNGQKIIGAVRRHLFDPFYSGREAGRGLGFGLSKVWAITKLHGGSIRFDDQAKLGTRFVMSFPGALGRTGSRATNEVEIESRAVVSDVVGEALVVESAPAIHHADES